MFNSKKSPLFFQLPLLAAVFVGMLLRPATMPSANAYTPDSPEVKDMVARGYKSMASYEGTHLGQSCMVALAFVKDGKDDRHPIVGNAVKLCKTACAKKEYFDGGEHTIYAPAVACIFLCELDPPRYKSEIEQLLKFLVDNQKPIGGWGYLERATGDTSQVQYAALSLWTAHHAGMKYPKDAGEKGLGWLLRTQDPEGGYAYQGVEGSGGNRVPQPGITPSLSSAGVSSLFVFGDLLGYTYRDLRNPTGSKSTSELPPALKLVVPKDKEDLRRARVNRIPLEQVRRAMADGARYCDKIPVGEEAGIWHNYFMYAYERFQSFHELANGQTDLKETKWYDDGVRYLKAKQAPEGGWVGASPQHVDTAFAVLFLIRSTKKAIAKVVQGEGMLEGGKGFRGNMANAKLKDGKIIGTVQKGPVDEMLSVLEDPQNLDIESLAESPEFIELSTDPKKLAIQVARLRRLVSAEKYEVRLVAVKTLGRTGDFDNVPVLVYALTDPDFRVVKAAHDGLRIASRKFDESLPSPLNEQIRVEAILKWKKWYKSVNPAAIFLD